MNSLMKTREACRTANSIERVMPNRNLAQTYSVDGF